MHIDGHIYSVDGFLVLWRISRSGWQLGDELVDCGGGVFVPLPPAGIKAESWATVRRIATQKYSAMFPLPDGSLEKLQKRLVTRLKEAEYRQPPPPVIKSRDIEAKRAVGSYCVAGGGGFCFDSDGTLRQTCRPGAITLVDELVDLPSSMEELLSTNTELLTQLVSDVSPNYLFLMHLHARAAAGCADAVKWMAMIIGYYRNGLKSQMANLMAMLLPSVLVAQPSAQEALVLSRGRGGLAGAATVANKYSRATVVLLDEMKMGEINVGWIKSNLQRSGTAELFPPLQRPLWTVPNKQRLVIITSNVQYANQLLDEPVKPEDAERVLVVRVGPDETEEGSPPPPELAEWMVSAEKLLKYLKSSPGRIAAVSYLLNKAKDPLPPLYSGMWPTLAREMAELRAASQEAMTLAVSSSSLDRLMAYVRTKYVHCTTSKVSLQELCIQAGISEGAGGRKFSAFFSTAKKAMEKEFGAQVYIQGKHPRPGGGRSSSFYALELMPGRDGTDET